MTQNKIGLIELLNHASDLLDREAEIIRDAHMIDGRWAKSTSTERQTVDEMLRIAKSLRRARNYHKPNPLGGPAKMFDAIADRIRIGESVESVMRDYDIKFIKRAKP